MNDRQHDHDHPIALIGLTYSDIKRIESKLDEVLAGNVRIEANLAALINQGVIMAANLTALTAEVTRNTEVDQSAITLLNGLAAQIESLKTDPVALQALADTLKGSSTALADAVVANTPASP